MNKLHTELARLYGLADTPADHTRCLQIRLPKKHWNVLADMQAGLGEALDFPPAALSVEAAGGYRLWLSLATPLPLATAEQLFGEMQRRWLGDVPAQDISWFPGNLAALAELPSEDPDSGRWSAFIDPSLGALFADEDGLDFPPTLDAQAQLLAPLRSIADDVLTRALAHPQPQPPLATPAMPSDHSARQAARQFLLAVMNDEATDLAQRIAAASALLAHCGH